MGAGAMPMFFDCNEDSFVHRRAGQPDAINGFRRVDVPASAERIGQRVGADVTPLRRPVWLRVAVYVTGYLFWPLLVALLLAGILLGIGLWTAAAAVIALLLYLICKSASAHHLQCELVAEALRDCAHDEEMRLSPHLRRELEQVMSRVRPDDLSVVEIAALLAILVPAHSRVVGGPACWPVLRVVGARGEHAAPDLA
jgi:hypothetical protein